MEDGRIIELYWDRDQRAIPETAGKYGRMLHGIAWNLLNGAVAWWLLFRQNRRNVFAGG